VSTPRGRMTFLGRPRPPQDVPLRAAARLGIRQVLDGDGNAVVDASALLLGKDQLRTIYSLMVLVRAIDKRGWQLQRSGRVEFWIPAVGQEAAHIASAIALRPSDWIFLADREPGVMLLRGAPLEGLFAQFFGRYDEPLKGRRLPLLLGDRRLNISPCTTQVGSYLPHAAGAAWAAKIRGDDTRCLVYFGDGATSRGEFHSAMNFAGVFKPPVIFFCQNNQWAVSTPTDRQTASATFAEKAGAYGVRSVRVDGNDPLAIHAVVTEALAAMPDVGATLIEAVTYRLGFHTSSDNPDLYRTPSEVAAWAAWDPIMRTRKYLERRGWWSDREEQELVETCASRIDQAVRVAESLPPPPPASQFDDVFADETWMLAEQRRRLLEDLAGEASSA